MRPFRAAVKGLVDLFHHAGWEKKSSRANGALTRVRLLARARSAGGSRVILMLMPGFVMAFFFSQKRHLAQDLHDRS